jgi:pyruvate dehydrogenase kinase 2/3/4
MSALLGTRIAALARQRATAVSLRDLFKYGNRPSPSVRLQNAIFLQRELPIRMAQRVEELKTLPFGLHQSRPIVQVIDWYSGFVDSLLSMPPLQSCEDEQAFTATIETMLQTPDLVVVMLSSALLEVDHAGATRSQQLSFLQSVFDRFFTARIGLRFLMEHHINSNHPQPDGWAGVIQANFNPVDVIREAAEDASRLCDEELGVAPEVLVRMAPVEDEPSPERNSRLTYVPSHLHFICTELLKNAMRATATRHRDAPALPPVTVTAAFGADSLGVRISDEGGGLSNAQLSDAWRYA